MHIGLQLSCLKFLVCQSAVKIKVGGLSTFDLCVLTACQNNKPFCTWTVKTFYKCEALKHLYTKTICSIYFKLTVFNKDTISTLNINFLRNQMKSYSNINIINIANIAL